MADPEKHWLLPPGKYSGVDTKVLDLIRKNSTRPNFDLYATTCNQPNLQTLEAVNEVPFSNFKFVSANLFRPLEGALTMRDLRFIDPHFPRDEEVLLGDGGLKYAIGLMARHQHESLVEKTIIVDMIIGRNTHSSAKSWESQMKNCDFSRIFDKELILIPIFYATTAILTAIVNAKGALIDKNGKGGGGVCEVFHFVVGPSSWFRRDVPDFIEKFLKHCALHYEVDKKFEMDKAKPRHCAYDYIVENDNSLAILTLMSKILAAKHKFWDLFDLDGHLMSRQFQHCFTYCIDYKNVLQKSICGRADSTSDPTIKRIMAIRSKIIEEYEQKQQEVDEPATKKIRTDVDQNPQNIPGTSNPIKE